MLTKVAQYEQPNNFNHLLINIRLAMQKHNINAIYIYISVFHLAISTMAQRHVAFCERHVALHERHVALLIFRR